MTDKRLFIGSFMPHEALKELFENAKQNLNNEGRFKWTRTPENFHITFHFIGSIPEKDLWKWQDAIQDLIHKDFDLGLQVSGLNFFKKKGRPSVLYAALKPNQALYELHQDILNRLYNKGLINEKQDRFTPHITFARIKKTPDDFETKIAQINRHFKTFSLPPVSVKLIESVLSPQGALYRSID